MNLTELFVRLKNAKTVAYYYDGLKDKRNEETGWWLMDELRMPPSNKFPVNMSFKFVNSYDRGEYTFPLLHEKYVAQIQEPVSVNGSWSLDVTSPVVGTRPFAAPSAPAPAVVPKKKKKKNSNKGRNETNKQPTVEEAAKAAAEVEEEAAEEQEETAAAAAAAAAAEEEQLGRGLRRKTPSVRSVRYSSSGADNDNDNSPAPQPQAQPQAPASSSAPSMTATVQIPTGTAGTSQASLPQQQRPIMPAGAFNDLMALAHDGAGPSNPASLPEILAMVLQMNEKMLAMQAASLQHSIERGMSAQRQTEMTMQFLMDGRRNNSVKPAGEKSSHRTCCYYLASANRGGIDCKGRQEKGKGKGKKAQKGEPPNGVNLRITSINLARERAEEVPVFISNPTTILGYTVNSASDLGSNIVCNQCAGGEFHIPVGSSNRKYSCVICKVIAGEVQSWDMPRILCRACNTDSTEANIKNVLPRLTSTLNKVTNDPHLTATLFVEPDNECKLPGHKVDALLLMKRNGEIDAVVVLELDGHAHRDARYKKEHERNHAVVTHLAGKYDAKTRIMLIRFNSNGDVRVLNHRNETELNTISVLDRMLVLQSWLLAILLDTHLFPELAVLYLFYSHDSPRIWRPTDEFQRGNSRGKAKAMVRVDLTHKAVIPGDINSGTTPWWRYFPDPLVPFQLSKHHPTPNQHPFLRAMCVKLSDVFQV